MTASGWRRRLLLADARNRAAAVAAVIWGRRGTLQ
jgi:hypothetical protein